MSLTRAQMEVYQYCDESNYIAPEKIEELNELLEQDGNSQTLSYALEKFVEGTCPKCNAPGAYKFHFMGKLKHDPGCGWSWHMGPGNYSATQLGKVFHAGMSAGGGIMSESKDKTSSCIGGIFGFIFGSLFRLFFAVLMIPIQAIVSLTQPKPESGQSDKE